MMILYIYITINDYFPKIITNYFRVDPIHRRGERRACRGAIPRAHLDLHHLHIHRLTAPKKTWLPKNPCAKPNMYTYIYIYVQLLFTFCYIISQLEYHKTTTHLNNDIKTYVYIYIYIYM